MKLISGFIKVIYFEFIPSHITFLKRIQNFIKNVFTDIYKTIITALMFLNIFLLEHLTKCLQLKNAFTKYYKTNAYSLKLYKNVTFLIMTI